MRRDGEPREGLGLWRETPERTETSVRDMDPVERWEPTRNGEPRKAGDPREGQKPQGMMGTPRRVEPFLPLCHTPWAGSFLCPLRPGLPVPTSHHKLGTAEGQDLGSITPPAAPLFLFPPPPPTPSPRGAGEQPGGCRGVTPEGTQLCDPFPAWDRPCRPSGTWGCSWGRARSPGWPR